MRHRTLTFPALTLLLATAAHAQTEYYRHSVFDNSLQRDVYYYSSAQATAPSSLEGTHSRLPVDTGHFLSPPNALRIHWQSMPGGGWDAEVHLDNFRNRSPGLSGRTLYFWVYSSAMIAAADLPNVMLSQAREGLQVATFPGSFTAPEPLGRFIGDLPADKWVEVRVPMTSLHSASVYPFIPEQVQSVIFLQGRADGVEHTLLVDQVHVGDEPASPALALATPLRVAAKGYERHVVVEWAPGGAEPAAHYVVYRSQDGGAFRPIGIQVPGVHRFVDWLGRTGVTASYRVAVADWSNRTSTPSAAATASTHAMSDEELLTMLQEAAFHYYWEGADFHSGMTHENIPGDDRIVATGASGFGIMALLAGTDRGFITRAQGLERLTQIVNFLEHADRYHGAWSHYMNGATGHTMAVFGMLDNGGDLVETAFLMQGLLTARQYFNRASQGSAHSINASRACGNPSSGTGTATRRSRRTSSTGTGRRRGDFRSITRSSASTKSTSSTCWRSRRRRTASRRAHIIRVGRARRRWRNRIAKAGRGRPTATITGTGRAISAFRSTSASGRAARCSSRTTPTSAWTHTS